MENGQSFFLSRLTRPSSVGGSRATLTPRFTDFFTDFEGKKKTTVLQSSFKTGAWGNSKMACFIPKIHYLLGNKSSPWDMVTYFQTNKTLEINGNLLSREVRKLLFSVLRREQWDNMLLGVAIAIFCPVCIEEVALGLDNL